MLTTPEHLHRDRVPADRAGTGVSAYGALDADELVDEIARRRHAVVHPLLLATYAFFGLSLLALAYLPTVVGLKVWGSINVAYLLAVAQFVATFVVAAVYSRWAGAVIDPLTSLARSKLATLETGARP